MVEAENKTYAIIEEHLPQLEERDILLDGENAYFKDTQKRDAKLKEKGIHFIGTGVSGGEEGALTGPSIMPGGAQEAHELVRPILESIAAKVDGEACTTYIGPDGAGHFVKMVHNGIEYGDMQLISEAYFMMKHIFDLTAEELHDVFSTWNEGELDSYLIEITADIIETTEEETGEQYLVKNIVK